MQHRTRISLYKKEAKDIVNGKISYRIGGNVLFDKLEHNETALFLYQDTVRHKEVIHNFLRQNASNGGSLFYISHTSNQLPSEFKTQAFSFNVITENTIQKLRNQLDKYLKNSDKANNGRFLVCDWSKANVNDYDSFLFFLKDIIQKSHYSSNPPVWAKHHYKKNKKRQQNSPLSLINIFETTAIKEEFLQKIIPLHHRVYLFQEKLNLFSLPVLSPSSVLIYPKFHVLPQEILEKVSKQNLELIILILLEKNPMSGYCILKEIARHFRTIVSQGAVYPILYRLEKEEAITKENGRGRELVYSLTPKTKDELQFKKELVINAYQHMAGFLGGGGGGGR